MIAALRDPILGALWDISTPDGADRRFRETVFEQLPYRFRKPAANRYRDAFNAGGISNANSMLLDVAAVVKGAAVRIAGNDSELCEWAEKQARTCEKTAAAITDQDSAYLVLCEIAKRSGVVAPEIAKGVTVAGAIKRMACQRWWRRQARKHQGRGVEGAAITLGMVHRRAELYASDESVERRAGQKRRNRLMLESCLAVNELGDEYTLAELADLSVSNPVIKRGELMTRMAGFEAVAKKAGHIGEFYSWTCPSAMHAHLSEGGVPNPRYDGTTPRAAQQYLCRQWSRARAALKRLKLGVYGFRVCEPHHDGTPHWHMLFFMAPEHSDEVRRVLRHYALQVDGDEPGAAKHRFTAVRIDPRRGTAAGYLAKYVAKNIDGFGVDSIDEDLFGRDPAACAARVDAWASTWGIRQFQQIGGASVTVWRELRKLHEVVDVPAIESARQCADLPDWAGYIEAQHVEAVQLHRVWSDRLGAYGEAVGWQILGVSSGESVIITRDHTWEIRHEKGKSNMASGFAELRATGRVGAAGGGGIREFAGGQKRRSRGDAFVEVSCKNGSVSDSREFLSCGSVSPWSPVNNCTGGDDGRIEGAGQRVSAGARDGPDSDILGWRGSGCGGVSDGVLV